MDITQSKYGLKKKNTLSLESHIIIDSKIEQSVINEQITKNDKQSIYLFEKLEHENQQQKLINQLYIYTHSLQGKAQKLFSLFNEDLDESL